jgi:hypothetical protein
MTGNLPADLAGGFDVFVQGWIFDPGAKNGIAAATAGIHARGE